MAFGGSEGGDTLPMFEVMAAKGEVPKLRFRLVDLTAIGEWALDYYYRLGGKRDVGMGFSPITNREMQAFQQNHNDRLSPFLIELVDIIDGEFIRAAGKRK
jgi:hypothetical protein